VTANEILNEINYIINYLHTMCSNERIPLDLLRAQVESAALRLEVLRSHLVPFNTSPASNLWNLAHLPFHIHYTPLSTKEETVTRTWKERLFTLPWQPWQRYKLQTQPAIYGVNLPPPGLPGLLPSPDHQTITFIAHPSFKDVIEKALKGQP